MSKGSHIYKAEPFRAPFRSGLSKVACTVITGSIGKSVLLSAWLLFFGFAPIRDGEVRAAKLSQV